MRRTGETQAAGPRGLAVFFGERWCLRHAEGRGQRAERGDGSSLLVFSGQFSGKTRGSLCYQRAYDLSSSPMLFAPCPLPFRSLRAARHAAALGRFPGGAGKTWGADRGVRCDRGSRGS